MLKDAGFSLPDINTEAYMATRSLTQSFIDDFLGYYINPQNRYMNSLLIGPGLPGGMMGSLMADLEKNLISVNKWLKKNNKAEISQEDLLLKLFEEVEYAWPRLGYPPLVTPFSQYVKNVSLMNAIQLIKGKTRWNMIDENTWGMILGRSGQLLGELGDEIKALAKAQERTYYTGNPQELYPDVLKEFKTKMAEKNWDLGTDQEELLEYAMHPGQYEAYKSGQAKANFTADLAKRKAAAQASNTPASVVIPSGTNAQPKELTVSVDGKAYRVQIDYGTDTVSATHSPPAPARTPVPTAGKGKLKVVVAPLEGKFLLTKDSSERPIAVGDEINVGDTIAYIESMKVINAVTSDQIGTVVEIVGRHGEDIEEDDVIVRLQIKE
jgi:pyruvate carboxylase subunit B